MKNLKSNVKSKEMALLFILFLIIFSNKGFSTIPYAVGSFNGWTANTTSQLNYITNWNGYDVYEKEIRTNTLNTEIRWKIYVSDWGNQSWGRDSAPGYYLPQVCQIYDNNDDIYAKPTNNNRFHGWQGRYVFQFRYNATEKWACLKRRSFQVPGNFNNWTTTNLSEMALVGGDSLGNATNWVYKVYIPQNTTVSFKFIQGNTYDFFHWGWQSSDSVYEPHEGIAYRGPNFGSGQPQNITVIITNAPGVYVIRFNPITRAYSFKKQKDLLISQICNRGATAGTFVELYNPTDSDINLNNYRIVKASSGSAAVSGMKSFTSGIIKAHGYYSVGCTNTTGVDETLSGLNVAANNAIILKKGPPNDDYRAETIDAVGTGAYALPSTLHTNEYGNFRGFRRETINAQQTPNVGRSIIRKPDGIGGPNNQDTQTNSYDFTSPLTNVVRRNTNSFRTPYNFLFNLPGSAASNQYFTIIITNKEWPGTSTARVVTNYRTNALLSVSIGNVTPSSMSNFINGVRSQQIKITGAPVGSCVYLKAKAPDGSFSNTSPNCITITAVPEEIKVTKNNSPASNVLRLSPYSSNIAFIGFKISNTAGMNVKEIKVTNIGTLANSYLTNVRLYLDTGNLGRYDGSETLIKYMTNVAGLWVATNLNQPNNQNYLIVGNFKRTSIFGQYVKFVLPVNKIKSTTGVLGPSTPITNANNQTVATTKIVINEVRYDPPGADGPGGEFIELKGPANASLYNIQIRHYNGANASLLWSEDLSSYNIPNKGGGVGYFVYGSNVNNVDLIKPYGTRALQNDNEAIALYYNNAGGIWLDSLMYEGYETSGTYPFPKESPYEPGPPADSPQSASRLPDGTDTDNNDADFSTAPATPGEANIGGYATFVFNPSNRTVGSTVTSLTLTITPMSGTTFTKFIITNYTYISYSSPAISQVRTNNVSISTWQQQSPTWIKISNINLDSSDNLKIIYNSLIPRRSGELSFKVYGDFGSGLQYIGDAKWKVGLNVGDIRISEIMWGYPSAGGAEDQWIELYNATSYTLNLKGCFINDDSGGGYTLKGNNDILPHWFYLLKANDQHAVPAIPGDEIYGITAINLNLTGDLLYLKDIRNVTIETLNFTSGWPAGARTNGNTDNDDPPGYTNYGVSMERINLTNFASSNWNWKNGPGFGTASESNEGGLGKVAGTPRGPNTPNVDGNPNDWIGIPYGTNMAVVSAGEWIWTDNTNDQRNDLTQTTNNLDIKEVRIRGDKGYIYFLIKCKNITATNLQHFAIAWDKDRNASDTAMNWVGPDSDTTLGHNRQYAETNISFHTVSGSGLQIELFGTSWTAPSGNYQIAASSTYDCIEVKINRSAGLNTTRPTTIRATMGMLKNTGNWNNEGNGTVDIEGSSDFIDVITPSFQNSWQGDLSDGDIDFWVDIKFAADGSVTNNPNPPNTPNMIWPFKSTNMNIYTGSNYYKPTIKWNKTTDPDGDTVWFYQVQISTSSNNFISGLIEDALRSPDIATEYTNYTMTTTCTDGGNYYVRVRAYDQYGRASAWTPIYGIHYPAAKRKIDGNPSDWLSYSAPDNSYITNSQEWVWKDRLGDERLSPLLNGDLAEFRVTADSRFIYILAKYNNITDGGLPMLGITINTMATKNPTGINWIGDQSLAGGSGSITLESTNQFGQVTLDLSYDGVYIFKPGGPWKKSSDTGQQIYISTNSTWEALEARIPLYDLGFTIKSLTNMQTTVLTFQRNTACNNPETCDHTTNLGGLLSDNDGIDVQAPLYKNSWNADLYDSKAYYFYHLKFKSDGNPAGNRKPNRPTLLLPANGSTTVDDPVLVWNKASDPDGSGQIKFYHIQISTNIVNDSPPFSNLIDDLEITTTNTNYHLNPNYFIEGQTYRWRVRAYDIHGFCSDWSATNTFTIGTFRIIVDGNTNDWKGVAKRADIDSWIISSNEFIWIDNKEDERRDKLDPDSDYDMLEFRVVADTNLYSTTKGNIFFMVKFNTYSHNQRVNINIAIRTNQGSGAGFQNWMGDDAEVGIGETKSQPDFNINWCYDGNNDIYIIPVSGGNYWDRPISYKSYIGKVTECRISANSLGLDIKNSPTINIRVAIAKYSNAGDPDDTEKNADISGSADFLDCMNPGSGRGYSGKDGTWWDEMSDADYDFWVKIKFTNNGNVIRATSKGMPSEDTLKDNYPSIKIVKVAPFNTTITDYVELYCERDGNNSGGISLLNYKFADDEGVFKTIGNATINSNEKIRLYMGNGTDETTAGSDGILTLYANLNNARLGPNDKIEFLIPYTNDGVRSVMDAVCWQSNQSGILSAATNIYYAGEWWTNTAAGALEYTNLSPNTSCFIRKTNSNGTYIDNNHKSDWDYERSAYYVNDGWDGQEVWTTSAGSDTTGTGAPKKPFATIAKVVNSFKLKPGDTVYVDYGTYNTNVTITSADSGTNNNPVVFRGTGTIAGKYTRINGAGSRAFGFELSGASNIKIIGFNVRKHSDSGIKIINNSKKITILSNSSSSNNNYGVYITNSYFISLTNNKINTNIQRGILISDCKNINIYSNQFYGNKINSIYIENTSSSNIIVQKNYITATNDYNDKIVVINVKKDTKILNNIIKGNNWSAGVKLSSTKNCKVLHNTLYSNWFGIYVEYSTNNLIGTNLIYKNAKEGVYLLNASASNTVISNTVYSNGIASGSGGIGIYLYGNNVKYNKVSYNFCYNNDMSPNNDNIKIEAPKNEVYLNRIKSDLNGKGIVLISPICYSNNIYKNTLYSNNNGFWIGYCKLNNITENTLYKNKLDSYAIFVESATNNYFARNYFYSNYGNAFQLNPDCISNKVFTNTFRKNDQRGIQMYGDNSIIKGNKIYKSGYQGICIESAANQNIIRDNIIGTNGSGDWTWHAGILVIGSPNSNQIINNQCFSNHPYGISLIDAGFGDGGPKNYKIQSNICYKNDTAGIRLHKATNNFILNNNCYSNQYSIYIEQFSSRNRIKGNITKRNSVDGIYLNNSPNNRIVSNYALTNTSNNGITFENSANNNYCASNISAFNAYGIRINNSSGITLYRNAVYHNNRHGIWLTDGDNNYIYHNSFASNDQYGNYDNLRIDANSTGNQVINNIFAYAKSATGYGVNIESGGSAILKYNDVYGNISGNYGGTASAGSGSISADPQWLSYDIYSTNFLYLTDTSPCFDAGTNLGAWNPYVGFAPDMGWKEYTRPFVKLRVSKTNESITLGGTPTNAIPGATVTYKITYTLLTNLKQASNIIIYDKLDPWVIYNTNYLGTALGWTAEYSTNTNPDMSYNSPNFTTTLPNKNLIKWVRWKKQFSGSDSNKTIYLKVIIK